MATIKPFSALRPVAEQAKRVSCLPYDVVYESEVRDHIERNSLSFLRVTRAEGEFPAGANPSSEEIFERARQNLDEFIREGILVHDPEPVFYVYQLDSGSHTQTGLVACCSLDDYESGHIKKHEKVRPDKVADRTDHMLAVRAQTGLIFLAVRGTNEIHRLIDSTTESEPIYEFECPEGVMQRV